MRVGIQSVLRTHLPTTTNSWPGLTPVVKRLRPSTAALFRWPPGCYLRLNGGRPGHFTPFAAPPMISLTSQRATPQRHCATGGERPCPAARSGMIWLQWPGPIRLPSPAFDWSIPAFAIKFPGNTPSNSSTALSVTCTRPGTLPLKIWLNIAMVLPLQSG